MNLDQAVDNYRPVSLKVLKRMVEEGLISEPLTESDQRALMVFSKILADSWYVAQMNKAFRPEKRAMMLAFPNFGKIERFILNSYLPSEFKPKTKVSVRELAKQIKAFYGLDYPEMKIKRVRQIAYNLLRNTRGKTKKLFFAIRAMELQSEKK